MTMTTNNYAAELGQFLAATVGKLPDLTVPISQAQGHRLAADLVTQHPSPRFDNSQMDGYGIGYANLAGGRFRVGPDIPAGTDPSEIYHYGVNGYGHDTAVPIMTGAKIPEDVVAIVPVEHADPAKFVSTGEYVRLPAVEAGSFIRPAGGDMQPGTLLASAGSLIDATLIATAASQGMTELTVKARPRVAVIAGGDEVVTGGRPVAAKIFDANTPLVLAMATSHQMNIVATAETTDELRQFRSVLDWLITEHAPHLILTSGGISEGKYEVVRQLLERLETSWVGKVEQQPGGPQGYGLYGSTPIIALPGNPISTMVSMRMLVLPGLWQAFASGYQPVAIQARINDEVTGLPNKTQYRRAIVGLQGSEVIAQIHGAAGSHLLAQAVGANALIEIPPLARFEAGDTVNAHIFADSSWDNDIRPLVGAPMHHEQPNFKGQAPEQTALVIVASTRAAGGVYRDEAGPKLVAWLQSKGFQTPEALVVADHDLEAILKGLVAGERGPLPDVLITSGGTGISPTDQTVDVIAPYLDKQLPNVMTAILLDGLESTPHAALSRGIAGLIDNTFVVTLPGSLGGVRDGIAVLDRLIDHVVEQIRGKDHRR